MTERITERLADRHDGHDGRPQDPAARPAPPQAAQPGQPGQPAQPAQARGAQPAQPEGLVSGHDLDAVSRRWHDIQAGFVDQPQQAVRDADALVADLMERIARTFADERRQLETQWSRGDQVSTEDLRVSLTRYRSFFQRLLSIH